MQRLKALRGILEKMLWFAPALILGIGTLPNVAGSLWWDVFGVLLFLTVLFICGIGLQQKEDLIE
ncbi:hypothetical protein [Paenibacillus planticolens]|uniref:Uncharacterized protein n=1 Tax=Paenibacillus planticolens TaxID=2654976 RepID=A0ABX1ZPP9_9BACL|nr:hypothetical protein [Paenibacillus planticolens]NOV02054.1 hypothetical protein [Paenibacillus planticolens]